MIDKKVLAKLKVMQGDITKLDVDAIVNAANTSLLGGGGVDGAIHRAAGPDLLRECRTLGGCPTGEARITKGYNLAARHVIHTVGPVYSGKSRDKTLLTGCYRNSLQLAIDNNLASVAFPAISCGVYSYPLAAAAHIAFEATLKFLADHPLPESVRWILFGEKPYAVFRSVLERFRKPPTPPAVQA